MRGVGLEVVGQIGGDELDDVASFRANDFPFSPETEAEFGV